MTGVLFWIALGIAIAHYGSEVAHAVEQRIDASSTWPGGVIPIANEAPAAAAAFSAAVRAWNESGANIRFEVVSVRRARVAGRWGTPSDCDGDLFAPGARLSGAKVSGPRSCGSSGG